MSWKFNSSHFILLISKCLHADVTSDEFLRKNFFVYLRMYHFLISVEFKPFFP